MVIFADVVLTLKVEEDVYISRMIYQKLEDETCRMGFINK